MRVCDNAPNLLLVLRSARVAFKDKNIYSVFRSVSPHPSPLPVGEGDKTAHPARFADSLEFWSWGSGALHPRLYAITCTAGFEPNSFQSLRSRDSISAGSRHKTGSPCGADLGCLDFCAGAAAERQRSMITKKVFWPIVVSSLMTDFFPAAENCCRLQNTSGC